ncbi:hypothetical protein [Aliiroseovarius sp. F47248L]|uniref:hypothetical protein n=1 Tax=Aliiroseovarius sp. F47248L TaxID=2926420 RepID=UPI001FF622A4|nr:hypothetical protein [Aliiroseovarius sp. F47248L]MCK0140572.1 hypothetical protein [Aliiroseovarius sp. F47248L]
MKDTFPFLLIFDFGHLHKSRFSALADSFDHAGKAFRPEQRLDKQVQICCAGRYMQEASAF